MKDRKNLHEIQEFNLQTPSITILKSNFTKQGGVENYARLLAEAFHKKGCLVTVLTTGPVQGDFPFEVVSVFPKSKTSVSKVWEFERFCQTYLKAHPTDIIFGLDRNRFQTHIRAGSGVHKCYLAHRKKFEPKWKFFRHMLNPLHTTLLHIEKTSFEYPGLKTLFANSHLVKEEILSHFQIEAQKIQVIHNGVDWEKYQKNFTSSLERKRAHTYQFLFIGNNFERKGLGLLLSSLSRLTYRDFHLTVVGYDKHQKRFAHLAYKKNLADKVSFEGAQIDISSYLQKSDCLVIPSYYDPFAGVTVEALAMGLFVISSKTNGGSEILTKESGVIIEDLTDRDSIQYALEVALKHPKTEKQAIHIRNSVKCLDFSIQLPKYLQACLSPI